MTEIYVNFGLIKHKYRSGIAKIKIRGAAVASPVEEPGRTRGTGSGKISRFAAARYPGGSRRARRVTRAGDADL